MSGPTHTGVRKGSTGWITLHSRPGRTHAHEVAETMKHPGETYTLTAVDAFNHELPAGTKGSRFRVDFTGQAVALVPTRLLERAAKLLNTTNRTLGDYRFILREIVGAADTTTTKGI